MKQTIVSVSRYGFTMLTAATLIVMGAAMFSRDQKLIGSAVQLETMPATGSQSSAPSAMELAAEPVSGKYSGEVVLEWVLEGVHTDLLPTPTPDEAASPPDLGAIDLALVLTQTGKSITGYVDLEKTLVFSVEHTLGQTAIGPYVTGTFDGVEIQLSSEPVGTIIDGKPIQRQFALRGVAVHDNPALLQGQYRETMTGYARKPMTVIGAFTLRRPVYESIEPPRSNHVLYLPLIHK